MPDQPPAPAPGTSTKQWSVARLHLPAEQAIEKIRANLAIPEADREHLIRLIKDTGFAGVKVDAHKHIHQGRCDLHITVDKLY